MTWNRQTFLRNALLLYICKRVGGLWWWTSGGEIFDGDWQQGIMQWSGDDGDEFLIAWSPQALVATACVLESDRTIEEDDGWDSSDDPEGEFRGREFLGKVPDSVQKLYENILNQSTYEFITAGIWGVGSDIKCHDLDEEMAMNCGLEVFTAFNESPLDFLFQGHGGRQPWARLLSIDKDLKPVTDLCVRLVGHAFKSDYQLTPEDREIFNLRAVLDSDEELRPANEDIKSVEADLKRIGCIK